MTSLHDLLVGGLYLGKIKEPRGALYLRGLDIWEEGELKEGKNSPMFPCLTIPQWQHGMASRDFFPLHTSSSLDLVEDLRLPAAHVPQCVDHYGCSTTPPSQPLLSNGGKRAGNRGVVIMGA